jgi:hypothetical protein
MSSEMSWELHGGGGSSDLLLPESFHLHHYCLDSGQLSYNHYITAYNPTFTNPINGLRTHDRNLSSRNRAKPESSTRDCSAKDWTETPHPPVSIASIHPEPTDNQSVSSYIFLPFNLRPLQVNHNGVFQANKTRPRRSSHNHYHAATTPLSARRKAAIVATTAFQTQQELVLLNLPPIHDQPSR